MTEAIETYRLEAQFMEPVLESDKAGYFIGNEYDNFPHQIKIFIGKKVLLESDNMSTKGHEIAHILSGFYLDQLLDRQRIKLSLIQKILDLGFGAGCISLSKSDYPGLFDKEKAKGYIYTYIFRPMLRLEEKKNRIDFTTSQISEIFEINSELVKNLEKLAKASLDLGVIFKNQNKDQSRYMNLIYFQFNKWKERVKNNIKKFNKKKHQNKGEFETYCKENQDDLTFRIEMSSLENEIDFKPYNQKIIEINTLISQIGDSEFSFI